MSKRKRGEDGADEIMQLEEQIKDSQKNYNNIVKLLSLAKTEGKDTKSKLPATVSLCRVFARLFADGRLSKSKSATNNETVIADWLSQRYAEYKASLLDIIRDLNFQRQSMVLTLIMQLVKVEVMHGNQETELRWRNGLFSEFWVHLLQMPEATELRQQFMDVYVNRFDDVRHYTFMVIADNIERNHTDQQYQFLSNPLTVLLSIKVTQPDQKLDTLFCVRETSQKLISPSTHRKQAQRAWLAILNGRLDKQQRKDVLQSMTSKIVPWLKNVELLMDFLTDSYNVGGATSLLALSGLFNLMQEKNLDYPDFYTKLYSLLDADLLHSKHRSRFFRLLHVFMSSTHLPAAMVASFIKRLARLALHAPPAGIVAVVPWVYNMLKTHPTCTFMIHREPRTLEERSDIEQKGFLDPFDMDEPDPMETNAIDSSLWELESLQSHYHPNVASLARIISEQFTKQSYNLEDFLDHSYNSLIEAELGKDLKKTPVVEYNIPKTVFKDLSGDATLEELFVKVVEEG